MSVPRFRAWIERYQKYMPVAMIHFEPILGKIDYIEVVATGGDWAKFYPEEFILEQYTGLKDKNGKKIYEGDVLESTWNGDKAVVVWNNVEGEWEHYADFNAYSKYGGSVVIGNMHENRELLEEKE